MDNMYVCTCVCVYKFLHIYIYIYSCACHNYTYGSIDLLINVYKYEKILIA